MTLTQFLSELPNDVGIELADAVVASTREVLGISGDPKTKATPFAPPRRITGRLQRSVRRRGLRVSVDAPYAAILEYATKPHGFPHSFAQQSIDKALQKWAGS